MDYNKYFEKLLQKQKEYKNNFPGKKIFAHDNGKYHCQAFQYENVKYNFVISSNRSITYGTNFTGLIVEIYIDDKNYFDSYFRQLKEQKELIESELFEKDIIWQAKGESTKGTVCRIFAKKEVDIEDETKWNEYIDWQISTMIDFLKIMPKYTKNLKKEIRNMNYIELESKFRNYLKEKEHSQATLSTYPNMLKRDIPNIMKDIDPSFPDNVFRIQNITQLQNLYNRCLNGDLKEFNTSTQNRAPSAAINKYIDFLHSINIKSLINSTNNEIKIKNLMLYGAPGVGKTYNYKNLITMIEKGDKNIKEILKIIESEEDTPIDNNTFEYIKNQERVEFVTFHQSYSYEDFIEGYRPSEDENKIIRKDGIFKIIADKAKENLDNSKKSLEEILLENTIKTSFNNFVQYVIDNEDFSLSKNVDISNIDDTAFYYTSKSNGMKNAKIPFNDILEIISNKVKDQNQISSLTNISGTSKRRPTYPYSIYSKFIEYKNHNKINNTDIETNIELKNFYIVIDEINRGNISKIFGELITLIEEDKRDKYKVTLPYSKTDFTIPSNLYIISTMNSTDKSIATIDIALRRRFTFIKMKPKESLVKDLKAKELMNKLNKYIKDTLGEDYRLGHSYFMGDDIDLEFIVNYKIIPLLEEYYYGDNRLEEILDLINREEV